MKSILILVAGAALAAGPAQALPARKAPPKPPRPEWVRVGSYVDGGPVEVDKTSIFTSNGLTRAWWRTSFAEPRQDGTVQEKQLLAIDCGGLSTVLAAVTLDAQGPVISNIREAGSAALSRLGPATPGTTGEMVAQAACNLRPRTRATRR
jgi:hypothetical protein